MVVIRLSRGGSKGRPFFNIVVSDKRVRRDGRFIERLGFYNPTAKENEESIRIAQDRLTYWKSVGAQASPTVAAPDSVKPLQRHPRQPPELPAKVMLPALETAELPADAIEVARIADAWGIKGWFKVLPHSAQPEALFSSKRWFLQPPGAAKAPAARSGSRIREAKEHSDCIVASSRGRADRNAAEALRGARIFVAALSFPTAAVDEYYWVDLIGLAVVNREGVALGTVRELLATGPQTTLVLDAERTASRSSAWSPLSRPSSTRWICRAG